MSSEGIKKYSNLPETDHVARYVPWTKLRRADGSDEVIGINPEAFRRRPQDKGLSVTWCEYFTGNAAEQRVKAVQAIRDSEIEVRPKSGFAFANVAELTKCCASRDHKIKVQWFPEDDNPAHSEVRSYPEDDLELFEALASGCWSDYVLNSQVS